MHCVEQDRTIPSELSICSAIFHVYRGRFDGVGIGHRLGSGRSEKSSRKPVGNDIGNCLLAKQRPVEGGCACWLGLSKSGKTRFQANSRSVITSPRRCEHGFEAEHIDKMHNRASLKDERLRTATPHTLFGRLWKK